MYSVSHSKVTFLFTLVVVLLFNIGSVGASQPKKNHVLVFSLTKGFRHVSIADGKKAILKLADENGFSVDTSEDASVFNTANLKKYKALIFLSPTGTNVFNDAQKAAIKEFINNGGGFVGIHAATDFSYEWDWYGKMVGGYFESHPKVQEVKLNIVEPKNKMVKGLPQPWMHKDEWYNFKSFNHDVKVLIKADETSYKGGTMKNDHPVSWYHVFEGGRVFYTAMGHTAECYTDAYFIKHLWAGMKWAMK